MSDNASAIIPTKRCLSSSRYENTCSPVSTRKIYTRREIRKYLSASSVPDVFPELDEGVRVRTYQPLNTTQLQCGMREYLSASSHSEDVFPELDEGVRVRTYKPLNTTQLQCGMREYLSVSSLPEDVFPELDKGVRVRTYQPLNTTQLQCGMREYLSVSSHPKDASPPLITIHLSAI